MSETSEQLADEQIWSDEMDSDDSEEIISGRKAILASKGKSMNVIEKKAISDDIFRNRQRVMLLSSRGINHRQRHLMKDFEILLPHARKDAKFDMKGEINLLNELAELNNCNNTMYFEARKGQDLYLWISKTPCGPSAKFLVQNIHTMDELKMNGNCLKGSRPLLSFDAAFDSVPHFQLMKELLIHNFGTPRGHRKSKPFYDHVFSFTVVDGRIWFRNFQITEAEDEMVEIGPRFVLNPMRVFDGSFGGATLYENEAYVSPNSIRAMSKLPKQAKYANRMQSQEQRERKKVDHKLQQSIQDEVDSIFK